MLIRRLRVLVILVILLLAAALPACESGGTGDVLGDRACPATHDDRAADADTGTVVGGRSRHR